MDSVLVRVAQWYDQNKDSINEKNLLRTDDIKNIMKEEGITIIGPRSKMAESQWSLQLLYACIYACPRKEVFLSSQNAGNAQARATSSSLLIKYAVRRDSVWHWLLPQLFSCFPCSFASRRRVPY